MDRTRQLGKVVGAAAALACTACLSLPGYSPPNPTGIPSVQDLHTPSPVYSVGGGFPTPAPTFSSASLYHNWLHQSGGYVMDANSRPVTFYGVGWYGFEEGPMLNTPATVSRLGTDVVVSMQRLHLMGFNTVEVTFNFANLYNADGTRVPVPSGVAVPCSGTSSAADIAASVTMPGFAPSPNASLLTNVPSSTDGMCNDYFPSILNPTVVQRLAVVVDILTRNGFYVILQQSMKNNAPAKNDASLWNQPDTFVSRWDALVADLVKYAGEYENISQPSCAADPNNAPLALCHNLLLGVMTDIEGVVPDMTWEANPPARASGAHQYFTRAMTAINRVFPRAMLVVGGALQNGFDTSFNTGVNASTGAQFPAAAGDPAVASAASFFAEVIGTSLEPQLMFSFNVYGPTVNGSLTPYDSNLSAKIAADMTPAYGYLPVTGVPDAQQVMHPFPLLPVAIGGNPADGNDLAFLNAMHSYMRMHNVPHFVWWCWGATSTQSDVVDDMTHATLNPSVVNFLVSLGLTPL